MVPLTAATILPGRLSLDIPTAARQLRDAMGDAAPNWPLAVLRELHVDIVTPQFIVELATISAMLEDEGQGGDADVVNRVVAMLLGQPE